MGEKLMNLSLYVVIKQTVNKVASCYKYPVPKTEGILPAINWVKQLQC